MRSQLRFNFNFIQCNVSGVARRKKLNRESRQPGPHTHFIRLTLPIKILHLKQPEATELCLRRHIFHSSLRREKKKKEKKENQSWFYSARLNLLKVSCEKDNFHQI